jgi:ferric-dicitrate binding protein FerR (iron transport regulator)
MEDSLIFKYIAGQTSSRENQSVEDWLARDPVNRDHLEQLREIWKYSDSYNELESVDVGSDWQNVRRRIGFAEPGSQRRRIRPFDFHTYPILKIAALIVIVLIPALILEHRFHILTAPKTAWITVAADAGIREISLPDGSRLTLNINSEVSYPEVFDKRKRELRFSGEGYFDVRSSEEQPFMIRTENDMIIEVIGTEFSVRTGDGTGEVRVRVIEGKVSLYEDGRRKDDLIISEGEEGVHSELGFRKSRSVNPNQLSWKSRELVFRNTALEEVARDLSVYAGKTVILKGEGLKGHMLTASYSDLDLLEIIDDIALVCNIGYSIDKDTVIFHPAGN